MIHGKETCFNVFRRIISKIFNHDILPTLHEDQPDVFLLHIGSNDINNQLRDKTNTENLTEGIINIGKSSINLGLKEVIILLILPKNNIALARLTQQVNDSLREDEY